MGSDRRAQLDNKIVNARIYFKSWPWLKDTLEGRNSVKGHIWGFDWYMQENTSGMGVASTTQLRDGIRSKYILEKLTSIFKNKLQEWAWTHLLEGWYSVEGNNWGIDLYIQEQTSGMGPGSRTYLINKWSSFYGHTSGMIFNLRTHIKEKPMFKYTLQGCISVKGLKTIAAELSGHYSCVYIGCCLTLDHASVPVIDTLAFTWIVVFMMLRRGVEKVEKMLQSRQTTLLRSLVLLSYSSIFYIPLQTKPFLWTERWAWTSRTMQCVPLIV